VWFRRPALLEVFSAGVGGRDRGRPIPARDVARALIVALQRRLAEAKQAEQGRAG
jgi:hypothetical protein